MTINHFISLVCAFIGAFLISSVTAAALGLGQYEPLNVVSVWLQYYQSPPKELLIASFSGLVLIVIVFLFPEGAKDKYGSARWAKSTDARKMKLFANRGIILAKAFGKYLRFDKNLSVAVLAPPGTGKTAGIIIPTLLSCGHSIVAFDVKGELFQITSKVRSRFSRVLRFAPVEADSMGWNPLDSSILPTKWADKVQVVERIASILIHKKDAGDHWNEEARSVLIFFALYLIHKNGGTSFAEIRALSLSSGDVQEWLEDLLEEETGLPLRVIEEANSLIGKADKEFSGVFSSFKKALNVFADERVASATSKNDFLPSQLRKECTTVYLEVNAQDLDRLAPLMRLFFETTAIYLLSVPPENGKTGFWRKLFRKEIVPRDQDVTFMLDEFVRLGKMPVLLKNPALSRGNRFNSVFVSQDWGQIEDLYGKTGVSEMETTTAYKVIFQQNNIDTAERISRSIGDKTQIRKSKSRSKGGTSKSESDEAARLIRAQEITDLDESQCLVMAQGYMSRPVKAKICFWFRDRQLKNLVKNA
jgi:type IV secretion system protein VirD4